VDRRKVPALPRRAGAARRASVRPVPGPDSVRALFASTALRRGERATGHRSEVADEQIVEAFGRQPSMARATFP